MNKHQLKVPFLVASLLMSGSVMAQGSLQHFGQSASHLGQSASHVGQSAVQSAKATGNAAVGTVQVVAGVAAVPLKAVGAVGDFSQAAGDRLWNAATGQQPEQLVISDETLTAGPAPMMAIVNQ